MAVRFALFKIVVGLLFAVRKNRRGGRRDLRRQVGIVYRAGNRICIRPEVTPSSCLFPAPSTKSINRGLDAVELLAFAQLDGFYGADTDTSFLIAPL